MSDRFACGIAEQMIPRYAKGGCTDAEKRFLEKHCAECIECSVRLIHEKNKQEPRRAASSTGITRRKAGTMQIPPYMYMTQGRKKCSPRVLLDPETGFSKKQSL